MSIELEIFEINFDEKYRQHGHTVTLTQIGNSIYDSNLIENLEEISRQNYWYLEGECGFMGELLGKDIRSAIKSHKNLLEPVNVKLITENLSDDEFYRIQVSY